jgi:hypothetical protein
LQVSISEAMATQCSAPAVGACEGAFFPDGAFDGAGVELDTAVITEAR